MSTSGGQTQFRYTQTPSKVIHLRNLPWECTEEELVEVCKPFGNIVNTKCNVGANRNQAFVEFGPGDVPGNVLLVTMEGVEAGDVSIDVIHLVFSAFGFVHKIATFEKTAGFQLLASWPCWFMQFAHYIFRSHRSEHQIPVSSQQVFFQPAVGPDGNKIEPESNVLLASIANMLYAVTVDVIHTVMNHRFTCLVFSTFGSVQKIAIFEKNGGTQVDQNQAINMVTYYASSSEPAQVRGKSVYIQYSNRHEIVNNKGPGDVPGNVLLVTMEGVEAGDVSIDVIHLVFSAFGFVHKIATFEKTAGFQALIQFTDAATALSAREALDGRSIPRHVSTMCYLLPGHVGSCNLRITYSAHTDLNIKFQSHRSSYLLPGHVGSCNLRITYSAHTDLNIKFQSHRSRDYTNPYLPVNSTAIEGFAQHTLTSVFFQPAVGPDGNKIEPESNVLLASIANMLYAVTVDVIHTVFSTFGSVQKIAIFEKNGGTQVLVQYPDARTAAVAKDALEGHCIYDGGYCKLHLSYSRHTDLNVQAFSDKSRDYTVPESAMLVAQHASSQPAGAPVWQTHHPGQMYSSGEYAAGSLGETQPPAPPGQAASWNPNMQGAQTSFASGPGQTYGGSNPGPVYSSAGGGPSMRGQPTNMQPGDIQLCRKRSRLSGHKNPDNRSLNSKQSNCLKSMHIHKYKGITICSLVLIAGWYEMTHGVLRLW
ncbi:Nucleotide-binding, alpha-beta plait [Artemisia annua]|uniref:Nucleotide-binding, alpha-beta plait n=1 Tax=Artemisia annua TaxID=35608 RepID=A0A2U1NKW4_ARTAN|nr:Nucleotide-binding, alpha-beta plait [Artemisia annua]